MQVSLDRWYFQLKRQYLLRLNQSDAETCATLFLFLGVLILEGFGVEPWYNYFTDDHRVEIIQIPRLKPVQVDFL